MNFGSVHRELVEKKKLLVKAEQAALQFCCNFRLRELKKDINGLLIKKTKCRGKEQKVFGWLVVIKTPSSFIAEQLRELGATGFMESPILQADGFKIKMKLQIHL